MIKEITAWIMNAMQTHGAITVFVGVIIESIIVPIPSPLIIMGAGVVLIPAGISAADALAPILLRIVLPGALASTIGAFFAYGVAYWGGTVMVQRWRRFLGFDMEDVMAIERRIVGRVGPMIFVLRALPIVPLSLISAAAGVLRLPWASFAAWTFAGSVPRCLLLGYLGFLTRDSYESLARRLNTLESILSAAIVLAAFALILWLRSRMKTAPGRAD